MGAQKYFIESITPLAVLAVFLWMVDPSTFPLFDLSGFILTMFIAIGLYIVATTKISVLGTTVQLSSTMAKFVFGLCVLISVYWKVTLPIIGTSIGLGFASTPLSLLNPSDVWEAPIYASILILMLIGVYSSIMIASGSHDSS
jgi:hypothetical protein